MRMRFLLALLLAVVVVVPCARAQEVDWVLDPPEPRAGDIVRFTISLTGGAITGSATFAGKTVPGFQTGGLLNVYFGVDLDMQPGAHELVYEMPGRKGKVTATVPVPVRPREVGTGAATSEPEPQCEQFLASLDEASRERAEREANELETIFRTATPQRLWGKAFVRPAAGPIATPFGGRRAGEDGGKSAHLGIDIQAPLGSPVYAANVGKVVLAKELACLGNAVILDHGLGLYTVYAHLSQIDVALGDDVERAKEIGLVGASGRVTTPRLHWAANIAGARVDPATLPGMAR